MKRHLDDWQIKRFQRTEVGRAYLEYNDKVGGGTIGLLITTGYPGDIENDDDIIATYKECIEKGITWEELLGWEWPPDDVII